MLRNVDSDGSTSSTMPFRILRDSQRPIRRLVYASLLLTLPALAFSLATSRLGLSLLGE